MPSIRDLFPEKWLSPRHLGDARPRVQIASVQVQPLFNPRTRQHEPKLVIAFTGKDKQLPINKTQAIALAQITGTDDYTNWIGAYVILSVGRALGGSETITISPVHDKDYTP